MKKKFNKLKESLSFLKGYLLLGIKILFGFFGMFVHSIYIYYAYFVFDILHSFYEKSQEDFDRDLSTKSLEKINKSTKSLRKNYEEMARIQKKHERDRKIKDDSLKLLNKLIAEGLIREKDLLTLAGTSDYFQLFVYSASLRRISNPLGITTPLRQYPIFLKGLGFVRLGKASSLFLISKNRLNDKSKLKDIKRMKKFLTHHFSKVRKKEWKDFLKKVKDVNRREYTRLKNKSSKEWGYLKYNFLLTETSMNPTNIGFVDGEYMGLGTVYNEEAINSQILERSDANEIKVNKQLKVKIRKIIEKLDISLLLDGILLSDKNMIDLKQDIIKKNLNIINVIDFHIINSADLSRELIGIGLDKKESEKIAKQIIDTTKTYKKALNELGIII